MAKKKAKSEEKEVQEKVVTETQTEEQNTETAYKDEQAKEENTENEAAKKIEELENTIKELNDKHLRLYSEFDNFRKRTLKEKEALSKTASEKIITSLLPVYDDFERAQKHFESNQDLEVFKDGMNLISSKFIGILENAGLKAIESTNQKFNTDEHEAITRIPAPSEDMKGKVIETTQKGYKLNEKVIRFAQVVVGS